MAEPTKVLVKQVRSGNRCPSYQRRTLGALGLGKIGRVRPHKWSPEIRGMVRSVAHLVEIAPDNSKPDSSN
jgi:large subunit ribosomal protein L30